MSSENNQQHFKNGVRMPDESTIHKIEDRMKELRTRTVHIIDSQIESMLSEVLDDVARKANLTGQAQQQSFAYRHENGDKVNTNQRFRLPDKEFVARNSLMTDLMSNKHIQAIYDVFLAILFGMLISNVTRDWLLKGELKLGHELLVRSFAHFATWAYIWGYMFISTLLVYFVYKFWAETRNKMNSKAFSALLASSWSLTGLLLYIVYMISFIYFFTAKTVRQNFSLAESVAVFCELTRFVMKTHAFVRTVAPRTFQPKDGKINFPAFDKYFYFLFVPTLIYRDVYPRTKEIRWGYVLHCFLEVFACIFYVSFLLERFLVPTFEDYCLKEYTWRDVVVAVMEKGMIGLLFKLCLFYAILHSWMNGFAEITRFADRMFYMDWWTSTSYGRYYRTWNIIVQDWLYTYIYKDLYEHITPGSKFFPKLAVFFISAVFHEFIVGFTFQFFFPIMFVLFFGIGLAMSFVKFKQSVLANAMVWYGMGLGVGMICSTLCMEYHARLNVPIERVTLQDYLVPLSFYCKIQ